MVGMIEIEPLRPDDRAAWEVLARGYRGFYRDPRPDEAYEATWQRLLSGTDRFYWHTQEGNTRARVLYDKVARFSGFIRYAYPL
jgi:hypothetical protein